MGCANSSPFAKRATSIPVSERLPVFAPPPVIGHADCSESEQHLAIKELPNPVFASPPDIDIEVEDEPKSKDSVDGTTKLQMIADAPQCIDEAHRSRILPTETLRPPRKSAVLEQPVALVEQKLPVSSVRIGNEEDPLRTAVARDAPFDMFVQLKEACLLTEVEVLWIPHATDVFHGRIELCVDDVLVAVGSFRAHACMSTCSRTTTISTQSTSSRTTSTPNMTKRCRLLLDEPLDSVQAFTLHVTSYMPGNDFLPLDRSLTIKEVVPRGLPVGSARPRRRLVEPPTYWETLEQRVDARVDLRDDVAKSQIGVFQRLLDETWAAKATRDRRGSMPNRLVVRKVQRIEALAMWNRFSRRRREMLGASSEHACTPLENLGGAMASASRPVRTQSICASSADLLGPCEPQINEHYLFHGTSPSGALGIIKRGFDMSKAGSSTGLMFGPGAYFAEASSKFDEYARPDELSGMCAVLVCRVLCGEMYHALRKLDASVLGDPNFANQYNGVLGDREASVGTYREFVVFSPEQIYPEYLVIYDRSYGGSSG